MELQYDLDWCGLITSEVQEEDWLKFATIWKYWVVWSKVCQCMKTLSGLVQSFPAPESIKWSGPKFEIVKSLPIANNEPRTSYT